MENKNNSYQEKVFDTLIQVAVEDILIQNEQELAEVETPESFEPSDQFLEWEKRFLASARRGERESQREARKKGGFHFNSALRRAAAIVLTVLVIGGGTVVSVDAFNPDFFKSIFKWGENYSTLVPADKVTYPIEIIPEDWDYILAPMMIPSGYKLRTKENTSNNRILKMNFVSDDGNILVVKQTKGQSNLILVDTEKANSEKIVIGNTEGYSIYKDGVNTVTWYQNSLQVYIVSSTLKPVDLIKIAESVELISKE